MAGGPVGWSGVNIRSSSGEQTGNGKAGKKASGMLMVDGVLAVGTECGQCPTGLVARSWRNLGMKAFGHSRPALAAPRFSTSAETTRVHADDFVYVYSHDSGDAYLAARPDGPGPRGKEARSRTSGPRGTSRGAKRNKPVSNEPATISADPS